MSMRTKHPSAFKAMVALDAIEEEKRPGRPTFSASPIPASATGRSLTFATGSYPKPGLSKPHPEHVIYPYLLRNAIIERPDAVWAMEKELTFSHFHIGGGEKGACSYEQGCNLRMRKHCLIERSALKCRPTERRII